MIKQNMSDRYISPPGFGGSKFFLGTGGALHAIVGQKGQDEPRTHGTSEGGLPNKSIIKALQLPSWFVLGFQGQKKQEYIPDTSQVFYGDFVSKQSVKDQRKHIKDKYGTNKALFGVWNLFNMLTSFFSHPVEFYNRFF